ncbi:uncharacterized protein N7496_001592 [Penicillium cataractarum]|uniref:Lysine-specific metallo-endopeptidase domain-containing protein n=1 Tax=Penicillium cataractarum TaxID=2100454 RepID=A0A9W9VWP0_9EURO|nr:uncharacterized protein N7496_001592 [Penicillium cataractarum]KAJ5390524.1 hypothetical protein N7496_001592 [Penicillium cataractarum]
MLLSSGWPVLLWMATVLLGLLAPVTMAADIKTSNTFKVLTDSDNMGGSCDSRTTQVDAMVPEIQALITAATDAIDTLLTTPTFSSLAIPSKKKNRERLLLLAKQFFGIKFNRYLKVTSGEGTLQTVKGRFNQITAQINAKDQKWRFGCDDSWVEYTETLKSEYAGMPSGTPITDVPGLGGITRSWAFFDKGGPTLRPEKSDSDDATQMTWYMSQDRGWLAGGPCTGIKKDAPVVYPDAQTLQDQQIIYFCPRLWDDIGTRLKDDVRNYKTTTIATDGTQYLDRYMTPGATLLHEMTHQIFSSADGPPVGLGYFFVSVAQGESKPDQAAMNADSYPYFAVAAYLSQVRWHTGIATTE